MLVAVLALRRRLRLLTTVVLVVGSQDIVRMDNYCVIVVGGDGRSGGNYSS
jgi:hypothetical protein